MPDAASTAMPCENTVYQRDQDRGYSLRRAFYVGLSTAFSLVVSATLVFMHYDGPLATQYVTGLLNFAGTICIFYLGAGVVDRQRFLERIGDAFGRRPAEQPQPSVAPLYPPTDPSADPSAPPQPAAAPKL